MINLPKNLLFDRYPVLPIVGGGHARLQPVYVRDVADGMINSLRSRDAIGQDYYMAGPEVLTCALGIFLNAEGPLEASSEPAK